MVTYNVDTDPRIRIYAGLAVASVGVAALLTDYLKDLASFLNDYLKDLGAILPVFVAPSIAPFLIFTFFLWLFDNYLWKLPLIRRVSGIPNLTGTWKGDLTRTSPAGGKQLGFYTSPAGGKQRDDPTKHDVACYITQTWRSMGLVFYDFAASKENASKENASKENASKENASKENASKENASKENASKENASKGYEFNKPTRIATARTVGLFVKNPQDIHVRYVYGARQTTMLHSREDMDVMPSEGTAVLRLRDLGSEEKKLLWGTYYSDKMRRGDINLWLEDPGRPKAGAPPTDAGGPRQSFWRRIFGLRIKRYMQHDKAPPTRADGAVL